VDGDATEYGSVVSLKRRDGRIGCYDVILLSIASHANA